MKHPFSTVALAIVSLYFLIEAPEKGLCQEPLFDLPVQLIGFPVIVLSVRLSNFAKKLAYSLNPGTYKSRTKRDIILEDLETAKSAVDVTIAEKEILKEFGPKACIIEEPCRIHAARRAAPKVQPDWQNILSNYKTQSSGMKQWYLLSVFVGDVIRSSSLCRQLAKRLQCEKGKPFIRD